MIVDRDHLVTLDVVEMSAVKEMFSASPRNGCLLHLNQVRILGVTGKVKSRDSSSTFRLCEPGAS